MFILLSALALSASFVTEARNPNPCLANVGDRFVNDYADCAAYFWCSGDVGLPAPPCLPGTGFVELSQSCTVDGVTTCAACPAEGSRAVADQSDLNCQRYFMCNANVRSTVPLTCVTGTRFNRITGVCDRTANVICHGSDGGGGSDAQCMVNGAPISGDVDDPSSCEAFFTCFNGELLEGTNNCRDRLHFNPATRTCGDPALLNPPCTNLLSAQTYVPRAPQEAKRPETMKDRVLARLHLKH